MILNYNKLKELIQETFNITKLNVSFYYIQAPLNIYNCFYFATFE